MTRHPDQAELDRLQSEIERLEGQPTSSSEIDPDFDRDQLLETRRTDAATIKERIARHAGE